MKDIFKLKIWMEGDNDNDGEFRDFYFDVNKINGWFIPDLSEEIGTGAINIFFEGDYITIKQEPHIVKWLTENFVEEAIINERAEK